MTKTRDGKENRKVKPRLYGNRTEHDPLKLYTVYIERRPEKAMNQDSPFYLTCIPWNQIDYGICYFPRPMGQNTLANIMSMAAAECGIDRRTNHSVRKSTIKTFRKAAGVARDKVKHVRGHKRTHSIEALTGAKSSVVPVAKSSVTTCNTKELVKPSSTITKESEHHDHGTNN